MRKALKDFVERIIPSFTKLDTQKLENDKLQLQLQKSHQEQETLKSKLKDFDSVTKEATRLKRSLVEAESSTEQAIRLAEQSNGQLQRERRDGEQMRASIHDLQSENKRLRDANEQYKNRVISSLTQTLCSH